MKASRKTLLALVGAMAVGAAVAAPSVEITSVQQQYPWTNTVDIVYNVAGVESETNGYFVVFTPTTSTGEAILDVNGEKSVQVALKGSGVYSTQWFPQTNQQYTACKMTPSVFRGATKDYMIVDLLTGAVTYEPMATQEASNQRYNTQEYKTTKLVLRRVPAKEDYYIGEIGNTGKICHGVNSYHKVSIPQDYYIGIYEVTEAQYEIMAKNNTSSRSTMPAYSNTGLSWNTIRGNALPAAVPTSGFLANLNAKTGLRGFDLPTESMWEIAARAGSTNIWISGSTTAKLGDYAWYASTTGNGNQGSGSLRSVGTKLPNAWGLYDVTGNKWELVRDAWNESDLAQLQTDGLKPMTSGTSRCIRGGAFWDTAGSVYIRLSCRYIWSSSDIAVSVGFRASYFPQ